MYKFQVTSNIVAVGSVGGAHATNFKANSICTPLEAKAVDLDSGFDPWPGLLYSWTYQFYPRSIIRERQ